MNFLDFDYNDDMCQLSSYCGQNSIPVVVEAVVVETEVLEVTIVEVESVEVDSVIVESVEVRV